MNTHVTISDIRNDMSKIREEIGGRVRSVSGITHHQKQNAHHPLDTTQVSYLGNREFHTYTFR